MKQNICVYILRKAPDLKSCTENVYLHCSTKTRDLQMHHATFIFLYNQTVVNYMIV